MRLNGLGLPPESQSTEQVLAGGEGMARREINPWEWSKAFGFSQAVELTGFERLLVCSGQTGVGDDGSVPTSSDMAVQVQKAFDNIGTVLEQAGFSSADVLRVQYFTTDVDELISVLLPIAGKFFGTNLPASTLLGVSRLAFPELKIEIEVLAGR